MSRDTFVRWKEDDRPSRDEIQQVLEDYARGIASDIRWEGDRFFVHLPGEPSWPFQRVGPATGHQRATWRNLATGSDGKTRPRWFEVYVGSDNIDVITRSQDEVTNNIARGFAVLMERAWKGEIWE